MGYAQIVSGGPDGRYVISLDFGESLRVALLDAATSALSTLTTKVNAQQVIVTAADDAEAATAATLEVLFAQIAADIAASPGLVSPAQKAFDQLMEIRRRQQIQHEPSRMALTSLKAAKATALSQVAKWQNLSVIETRNAWCADLTEDAAGYVATLEIPGESDLVLIEPGAPTPFTNVHGVFFDRALLSPATAFYNAALLPGWQKYKPTFRWGTITALDYEAHTADVSLASASSSAQGLGVNQSSSLSAVPVEYMGCDSAAFMVGSRVVVKFTGQDWTQPKVIGFLDNPRGCTWTMFGLGPSTVNYAPAVFGAREIGEISDILAGSCVVDVRVSRGAWVTMTGPTQIGSSTPPLMQYSALIPYRDSEQVRFSARLSYYGSFGSDPNGTDFPVEDGYVGCVWAQPSPMSPPAGVFPDFVPRPAPLEIVEIRVTVGSDVVFNAAVMESVYANEIGQYPMRFRGTGGESQTWAYDDGRIREVIPADEYSLFIQTGD